MRLKIYALAVVALTSIPLVLKGQFNASKGYANIAGGVTYFKPSTTGKNKMSGAWTGVNFRIKNYEFGVNGGQVYKPEKPDSLIPVFSSYFAYHQPLLNKIAIGQRPFGIKGFLIQPAITGYYGVVGSYKSEGSFFVGAAPGLSIQLPFVLLELRYNAMFNIAKEDLVKGLVLGPQINLQMDGLFDVFHPRVIKGGIQSITTMSYQPGAGNYDYYTIGKGQVTGGAKVITPFVGITPAFSFVPHYRHKPAATLTGIGASGRISFFSFDAFMRSGKMGFGTLIPTENGKPREYKTKKWDQSNDALSGTQKIKTKEYRFGFDVASTLMTVLYPGAMATKRLMYYPRYLRIYLGWGGGSYKIEDAPEFKYPATASGLYSNPGPLINGRGDVNSSSYNPTKFTDGKIRSAFMAIELGSIGFSWDHRVFSNAGLMSGQTYSVYSTIPIGRVWKAYKGKLPKDEVDEE